METDPYLAAHPDATPRLNAALVEVQKMLEPVKKAAVNPFFSTGAKKATYADLADVLDAILPALNAHGVAMTQVADNDDAGVACITELRHVSGEILRSRFWLPATKKDPQGYGSAFTYARRFGAKAAVGLTEEDDDGNSTRVDPKAKTAADYTKPKAPKAIDTSKLVAAFSGLGVTVGQLEDRIGKPLVEATEADVASLREYHKAKKALAAETPEALALRLEQEKAEKAIAAEQAKVLPTGPLFAAFVDRIRAATTPGNVALIVAEAAQAKLTAGDLKALQRTANDRTLVLNDALRRAPPTSPDLTF